MMIIKCQHVNSAIEACGQLILGGHLNKVRKAVFRRAGMGIDEMLALDRTYEQLRKEDHSVPETQPESACANSNTTSIARKKARSTKKKGVLKQTEGSSEEDTN